MQVLLPAPRETVILSLWTFALGGDAVLVEARPLDLFPGVFVLWIIIHHIIRGIHIEQHGTLVGIKGINW